MSENPSFCTMQVEKSISEVDLGRVHRAYEYIENNLENDISVDDIANAVNLSPFHFHRIFSKFVNVPILKFVNQWRLERAARQLVYMKHLSVTDIANINGYSSSANFARAFKNYFGVSAGEIRREGFISVNDQEAQIKPSNHLQLCEEALSNLKIQPMAGYTTVGFIGKNGYSRDDISLARNKLSSWIDNNRNAVDLSHKYDFFFDAISVYPSKNRRHCQVVKLKKIVEISEPFFYFCIRKGNYARIDCPTPLLESSTLVKLFLTQWLKENNCISIGAPMAKFDENDQSGYWLFRIKELG